MAKEKVILVDQNDNPIGLMEKMEAHEKAILHRAFSVFIFNTEGKLLLQERAYHKYHSPGLWTNTVCSHPREGETTIDAAHRRIVEEMGFDCPIEKKLDFVYKSVLDQGLTEHEFDPLFVGHYEGEPNINPAAARPILVPERLRSSGLFNVPSPSSKLSIPPISIIANIGRAIDAATIRTPCIASVTLTAQNPPIKV